MKQIIIPKENAVFRMDGNGVWHNEHGKIEHPKIIKYFHQSIGKDDRGYFVFQTTDEFEEKVYFPYEETAMFVFDILFKSMIVFCPLKLKLNCFSQNQRLINRSLAFEFCIFIRENKSKTQGRD